MKSIEFYILVKQPVTQWVYDEGTPLLVETGEYTEELKLRRMPYTQVNEEIAKRDSYNGKYSIVDDSQPEPEPTPPGDDSTVWDELDAAYQEGVDSV